MFDGGILSGPGRIRALALGANSCRIGPRLLPMASAPAASRRRQGARHHARNASPPRMGLCGFTTSAEIDDKCCGLGAKPFNRGTRANRALAVTLHPALQGRDAARHGSAASWATLIHIKARQRRTSSNAPAARQGIRLTGLRGLPWPKHPNSSVKKRCKNSVAPTRRNP